jgi:hypothetical protein
LREPSGPRPAVFDNVVHEAVCLIAEIVGSALRKARKLERNLAGRKKANAVFFEHSYRLAEIDRRIGSLRAKRPRGSFTRPIGRSKNARFPTGLCPAMTELVVCPLQSYRSVYADPPRDRSFRLCEALPVPDANGRQSEVTK